MGFGVIDGMVTVGSGLSGGEGDVDCTSFGCLQGVVVVCLGLGGVGVDGLPGVSCGEGGHVCSRGV